MRDLDLSIVIYALVLQNRILKEEE